MGTARASTAPVPPEGEAKDPLVAAIDVSPEAAARTPIQGDAEPGRVITMAAVSLARPPLVASSTRGVRGGFRRA